MADWLDAPEYKGENNGLFLKTEEGTRVRFVPLGKAHIRFIKWVNGRGVSQSTPEGAKVRFLVHVYNLDADRVQIFELAPLFWADLLDTVRVDGDGRIDSVYQVRQTGAGKKKKLKWAYLARHEEAQRIAQEVGDDLPVIVGSYHLSAWVFEGGRPVSLRDPAVRPFEADDDDGFDDVDDDDPRFSGESDGGIYASPRVSDAETSNPFGGPIDDDTPF